MAAAIGASMAAVGVHQGLAPVLDVTATRGGAGPRRPWARIPTWSGRSAPLRARPAVSRDRHAQALRRVLRLPRGPQLAPVAIGRREFADVILPPFEMAVRGAARSVMPPTPRSTASRARDRRAADRAAARRAGVRRHGRVRLLGHRVPGDPAPVAATPGEAAALALEAGLDVELPTSPATAPRWSARFGPGRCRRRSSTGPRPGCCGRSASSACSIPLAPGLHRGRAADVVLDLDPPGHRALARRLAEESVVLLANRAAPCRCGPRPASP